MKLNLVIYLGIALTNAGMVLGHFTKNFPVVSLVLSIFFFLLFLRLVFLEGKDAR